PNTALLIIAAIASPLIIIGFIGILAAIAIPAYQDYTQRAQVGEAFGAASGPKVALAEFAQANNARFPNADELTQLGLGDVLISQYSTITVEPNTGIVLVTMKVAGEAGGDIAQRRIEFAPRITDRFQFICRSEIEQKFLPKTCEGDARL
ncbi:MAG: pilin, partial [Pseudomonadota bacterium]